MIRRGVRAHNENSWDDGKDEYRQGDSVLLWRLKGSRIMVFLGTRGIPTCGILMRGEVSGKWKRAGRWSGSG